jgi:hemerythrin-like domain-containing protein
MSDSVSTALTDTSDMIRLHRVFREALGAAAPLVGSVAPGDTDRAEVVGSYYFNVLELLHAHHDGEDALVWPRLIERSPGEAETIQHVAGQHAGVFESLQTAHALLAEWRTDPQVDSGAQLAASLATLGATLAAHLDEEERVILPIASRHMTPAEWGELPAHGMQHFGGDKPWLILGLIQEQMSAEQVAGMEAQMPPPLRDFWTGDGRPMFRAFVSELRS